VTVDVWAGFAVQVVDNAGGRRTVVGPTRVLLGYDEMLEALSLSRGMPKGSRPRLETAYLRVAGNKVSDRVDLVTSDNVRAQLTLKYRVSFEGDDPARWFAVDDYVQLLCDHASSMLKAATRQRSIRALRTDVTDLVRDVILGPRGEAGEAGAGAEGGNNGASGGAERRGLRFAENNMRVFDVEVLDLQVVDEEVDELLAEAQLAAVSEAIDVAQKDAALEQQRRLQQIERALAEEAHATGLLQHRLQAEREQQAQALRQQAEAHQLELVQLARRRELTDTELSAELAERKRAVRQAEHQVELQIKSEHQALALQELRARVEGAVQRAQAFTPQLAVALNKLADEQLLAALAENFGELAAVEGRGLLQTARKFLDFVPATLLPRLPEPEREPEA
jgi:major vault protein